MGEGEPVGGSLDGSLVLGEGKFLAALEGVFEEVVEAAIEAWKDGGGALEAVDVLGGEAVVDQAAGGICWSDVGEGYGGGGELVLGEAADALLGAGGKVGCPGGAVCGDGIGEHGFGGLQEGVGWRGGVTVEQCEEAGVCGEVGGPRAMLGGGLCGEEAGQKREDQNVFSHGAGFPLMRGKVVEFWFGVQLRDKN